MSEESAQYTFTREDYAVDIDGVKGFTGLNNAGIDGLIRKGLFPQPFLIGRDWCWSSLSLQKWEAAMTEHSGKHNH